MIKISYNELDDIIIDADSEIKKDDIYIAYSNSENCYYILTCNYVDKKSNCIFPTDVNGYPFNINKCQKYIYFSARKSYFLMLFFAL